MHWVRGKCHGSAVPHNNAPQRCRAGNCRCNQLGNTPRGRKSCSHNPSRSCRSRRANARALDRCRRRNPRRRPAKKRPHRQQGPNWRCWRRQKRHHRRRLRAREAWSRSSFPRGRHVRLAGRLRMMHRERWMPAVGRLSLVRRQHPPLACPARRRSRAARPRSRPGAETLAPDPRKQPRCTPAGSRPGELKPRAMRWVHR
jgi:hypothetical protein